MPYLLFLKKQYDLKLSSAANYRWGFMVYFHVLHILSGNAFEGEFCSGRTCPKKNGLTCNGMGSCTESTSTCTCDPGRQGDDCSLPKCLNDCSGELAVFYFI